MLKIKICLLIVLCWFSITHGFSQDQKIADSLGRIYRQNTVKDTARLKLLVNLSFNEERNYRLALQYAEELIRSAQLSRNEKYVCAGYFIKGTKERLLDSLDVALDAFFNSAALAKKLHDVRSEANAYSSVADIYSVGKNHATSMTYYYKAINTLRGSKDSLELAAAISNAGDEFVKYKLYDSALNYFKEAKIIYDRLKYLTGQAYSFGNIGTVYDHTGEYDLAEENLNKAVSMLEQQGDYYAICEFLLPLSDAYAKKGDIKKAINYAERSLQLAKQYDLKEQIGNANQQLSQLYETTGDMGQSLQHYKDFISYSDSINNLASVRRMFDLRTKYEVGEKQVEVNLLNQQRRNQRILVISLGIILLLTIIILGTLIRNSQNRKKAYAKLDTQKRETETQKTKAENALNDLKLAQKQLIQSEKMASLGQLTAGIAHEIQNPLNFVNNFSDVNIELADDLRNELASGNHKEAMSIANDIKDNAQKINHHGKRADGIVKGMLQHSRSNKGEKEPTDINALASEYLKLTYHGLRAKDNTFNASMVTNFDESIGRVNMVPQEMGRLLINLYSNAFYAVTEKKKLTTEPYEPTVTVTTKKINNIIEIKIRDNGTGIPEGMGDKIFQPFFTTKPTGEGTGLGLSLSYEIVEAHGGKITVESVPNNYTEFIIQLPL